VTGDRRQARSASESNVAPCSNPACRIARVRRDEHPLPARAQDSVEQAAARAEFEHGREAYERGSFAEALASFERSYALSRHPKLLFNVARAAEADGKNERAVEAYAAYLQAVPDAENRQFVNGRLEKLRLKADVEKPQPALPSVSLPPEAAPRGTLSQVPDESKSRKKKSWLWAGLGTALAAGVIATLVITFRKEPTQMDADEKVMTLVSR
jgi:tetratricopeptide (TPR) repeat protein